MFVEILPAVVKTKTTRSSMAHTISLATGFNKKSTSQFVSAENIDKVRQQLADYKTFVKLKDEWLGVSIELSKLRKKLK